MRKFHAGTSTREHTRNRAAHRTKAKPTQLLQRDSLRLLNRGQFLLFCRQFLVVDPTGLGTPSIKLEIDLPGNKFTVGIFPLMIGRFISA